MLIKTVRPAYVCELQNTYRDITYYMKLHVDVQGRVFDEVCVYKGVFFSGFGLWSRDGFAHVVQ